MSADALTAYSAMNQRKRPEEPTFRVMDVSWQDVGEN